MIKWLNSSKRHFRENKMYRTSLKNLMEPKGIQEKVNINIIIMIIYSPCL